MKTIKNNINNFLYVLILFFPILIILGPVALNIFSIIFSLYAIVNYKNFFKLKVFNLEILIFFFTFIIFIFPYDSINFENSFSKYLAFIRFILMLFGLIFFFEKENKDRKFLARIYKTYILILTIIIIDVLYEFYFGSNILGFSSSYKGRIASFTNDELIIGFIFSILALSTLVFIYKNNTNLKFLFIIIIFLIISFLIGERSNFIKLTTLIMLFYLVNIKNFNFKSFLFKIIIIITLLISFLEITKNTYQGKKIYSTFNNLISFKENKISLNIKKEFLNTRHAAHYMTAYKIFLDYPVFGIGINNFYQESSKKKYKIENYSSSSNHPHQIYLEIISEVGLFGLVYFLLIFFYPIYISLKKVLKSKEINLISHLLLHIFFIFPILPSGSFFGTIYGIPFWFNLAILIYLSKMNLKNFKK